MRISAGSVKYWRILHKVRVSPRHVGRLAKAIHSHRTTKPPQDEDVFSTRTSDYLGSVITGDSEPLRGSPAPSPWDPALADAMRTHGRAVMERLIATLLADLGFDPIRG